jgi:hypothetical protein
MALNFLSVTWYGEAFHGLGVQGFKVLILVGALFLLDGGKGREGKKKEEKERKKKRRKKKITMGKEGFSRAGPTLLAVQWVAAVRCN